MRSFFLLVLFLVIYHLSIAQNYGGGNAGYRFPQYKVHEYKEQMKVGRIMTYVGLTALAYTAIKGNIDRIDSRDESSPIRYSWPGAGMLTIGLAINIDAKIHLKRKKKLS